MKALSLMIAILIICGCGADSAASESVSQVIPESSVSENKEPVGSLNTESPSSLPDSESKNDKFQEPEKVSAEKDNAALESEKAHISLYDSNNPAKESWLNAYKSFYNGKTVSQSLIDSAAAQSGDEKAEKGLLPRSDMGIEFAYSIYSLPYSAIDTTARDVNDSSALISSRKDDSTGLLVNYSEDGGFAGEIFVDSKGKTAVFERFEVGEYNSRRSLTVTEGIEAQLIDFGFEPESLHAFALSFAGGEYGICFYDSDKAAFYCSKSDKEKSLENRLYSLEELAERLCEIYDVCSLDEIDAAYSERYEIEVSEIIVSNPATAKPVIYLYPEKETEVSVKLGYPREFLTYTYPAYNDGWRVTAYPDGRIVNSDGSEHYYLFWEGDKKVDWDFSEGFCVKGGETERFLVQKLSEMGLTPREYNDFITYWLPEMVNNRYNIITFSDEQYDELAPLEITPEPDNIFRVHMVYRASENYVDIKPQQLSRFDRSGFSVLEWGGSRG